MALRRSAQRVVEVEKSQVRNYVRQLLSQDASYQNVRESEEGAFLVSVKPNSLMLGTEMKITVEKAATGTVVAATTISQPLVLGDAFGLYEQYIKCFFRGLSSLIREERGQVVEGDIRDVSELSWGDIVGLLLTTAAVAVLFMLFQPVTIGASSLTIKPIQSLFLLLVAVIYALNAVRVLSYLVKGSGT